MTDHDVLLQYSEWLDAQGVIKPDTGEGADPRSHDELVRDFLTEVNVL